MKLSVALRACLAVLAPLPMLAQVIVGLPPDAGTGSCLPFDCPLFTGEFQQVYASSQFPGPMQITGLDFFNTQYPNSFITSFSSGTFTISLSTTSSDWNTLGAFASNIGVDNTQVFSGNISVPWAFGDTLSIPLATSFTYAPAVGRNLLMDINVTAALSNNGQAIYFDTNGFNFGGLNGNTFMGQMTGIGGRAGYGLVTGFVTSTATPEPSSLMLLPVGLGLLGLVRIIGRPSPREG